MYTNSVARRIFKTAVRLALAPSLFSILLSPSLLASDLQEPITLKSNKGVLDLLMIAKPGPINTLASQAPGGTAPTGWVYEICERPKGGTFACPAGTAAPNYYGGTLLQLSKGDTLKIHLVNQLPPVTDSKHAIEGKDTGQAYLALNPTNLHTHGMLVSPNGPTATDPTYGDNVFVLTFNSANGVPPAASPHLHSTIRMDSTDYKITIPDNHPSGLFWFHPHTHGISLNQVSAGLGGIITVGNVSDYVDLSPSVGVRHIILKDTQILPSGQLKDQEDPAFCAPSTAGAKLTPLPGYCAGNGASQDGVSYKGGKWFFTLNGQVNPSLPVNSAGGEVWRIANVSGSATYRLNLWNPQQKRQMLMQVISIDGVSVKPTRGITMGQLKDIGGTKFVPENCSGLKPAETSPTLEPAICTRILHMMPSARVEVWVAYRDEKGNVANPQSNASAILRTDAFSTGPSGDNWPPVDLANVTFQTSSHPNTIKTLNVQGEAQDLRTPAALAHDMSAANKLVVPDNSCKALPKGHTRRIFYGVPAANPKDTFGLAYEELDEHDKIVGPQATDLIPFDPMHETICVPLGPNNSQVTERWQLVNVATEDHNFHIHQTKFRLVGKDELAGTIVPKSLPNQGVMMDNVPLPHANGTCGVNPPKDSSNPIDDFRSGACKTTPITVEIPFAIAGDFVYHCHILEHEDGGMMARIRVRPTQ